MISDLSGLGGVSLGDGRIFRLFAFLGDLDTYFKGWRGEDHVSVYTGDDGTHLLMIPFQGVLHELSFGKTFDLYLADPKGTKKDLLDHLKASQKKTE